MNQAPDSNSRELAFAKLAPGDQVEFVLEDGRSEAQMVKRINRKGRTIDFANGVSCAYAQVEGISYSDGWNWTAREDK
jgi:hypothetical protein